MEKRKRVAIIGAGPGGLATAMLLLSHGYEVDVYEKQSTVGGRSGKLQMGQYTFDRGATFLMMPHLLEQLFTEVGLNLHEYIQLIELDPLYTLYFGDVTFSPSPHVQKTAEHIAQQFPGNERHYVRFMEDEQKKFDRMMPLLSRPFCKWTDYLCRDVFKALPYLHLTDTVYTKLARYFTDERLRWAFTFQSKYLGMSAWECPGAFTMLSFLEHRYGLVHPIGGVHRVFEAMSEVTKQLGGRIHLDCGVKKVLVRGGRAQGLSLENGECVSADYVIINADFSTAMTQLFEDGILKRYTPSRLDKKTYSCSATMLYLGVDGKVDLPHHAVFFPNDYRKNVDEIITAKTLSAAPSFYVQNPSRLDPTMAPADQSALYVLMPTPNLTANIDWRNSREQVEQTMLARLEKIPALSGLSTRMKQSQLCTPLDWQQQLHVYNGATFNLTHHLRQMMYFRPHNQFEEVEGIFLVGGGTHPGSGLPTILQSAHISVNLLLQEDRKQQFQSGWGRKIKQKTEKRV